MFENKKMIVVGLGKSGLAAYELLKEEGADVILYDGNEEYNGVRPEAELYLGKDYPKELFQTADYAVFSPGVPLEIELADFFRAADIPILGEIELAYRLDQGQVIGITGTNGKTTTTTLMGEIMKAYNPETYVVGNIGYPYTAEVKKTSENSFTVAEISSFQLETAHTFCPKISAILNITPDHLNRHKTMENYTDLKLSIAKNQGSEEACILNFEDPILKERGKDLKCKTLYFSSLGNTEADMYLDAERNIRKKDGNVVLNQKETKLPGAHNAENIMAALLMAGEAGVPTELAVQVVKKFSPVPHRVELVAEKNGVEYYNDSKATNPDAAIKGILSMDRPTVLIGGGYDKNSDFTQWVQCFNGRVKKLLLMGVTREQIAQTCDRLGFQAYEFVDDLAQAMEKAGEITEPGDAVLLSPACASWDMFASYEERGDLFKEYVRKI